MQKLLKLARYGLLVVVSFLSETQAQISSSDDSILDFFSPQTPLGLSITQGVKNSFATDLSSPETGDLSILRLDTALSYLKKYETTLFQVGFTYEYSYYDWSAASPFDQVDIFSLNSFAQHTFEKGEPWGGFVLTSFRWGSEPGSSLSDGFSFLGGIGPTYAFSETFRLGVGLLVATRPQQATRYLPMVTLDWTINDHWRLRTSNGITVIYDLYADQSTLFDFTAQYEVRHFVLDAQTISTGTTDQPVVFEESVLLAFGTTQKIGGPFFIRGYLEATVFQEFEFRADRNKYQTIKRDPALGLGFQIGANF